MSCGHLVCDRRVCTDCCAQLKCKPTNLPSSQTQHCMAVADAVSASGQSSSIDRASAKSPHDQRNSFRDEEFGTEDQISPAKSASESSEREIKTCRTASLSFVSTPGVTKNAKVRVACGCFTTGDRPTGELISALRQRSAASATTSSLLDRDGLV